MPMKREHSTFKFKVMEYVVQNCSIIMLKALSWKSKNISIHSEERGTINPALGILESLVVLVAKVVEAEMIWE